MSSIAISVANMVAGMMWNKVLDRASNKLKDGDPTDEKCRQIIARELDDIKSKLDGLARKDLLSSVSFLSDGICLLNLSTQSTEEQKMNVSQGGVTVECSGDDPIHSDLTSVFNEALLLPMLPNVATGTRFVDARASFEKAYTKATEAFNNEALSTEDRILATKLRVISRILERLEDPDSSVAFCKLYLQELHDTSAVRKTFSTYFRSGGVKSRFRKTKRAQNVRVVMMINYVLFNYAKEFSKVTVDDIFGWPRIKLAKRTLHPLMLEPDALTKMERSGIHPPNQFRFSGENEKWPESAAVNSKGQIIVKSCECERLDVINNKGEIRFSFQCLSNQDTEATDFEILALTTDGDDDVYIVSRFKPNEEFYHYKLSVLEADGSSKREVPLESFTGAGERHHTVCVAVNKDKDIFITKQDEARVLVLDSGTGRLKHSFVIDAWHLIKHLSISHENEIIAAELVGKTVGIYTVQGDLKCTIETPELHKVCGLAYHHASKLTLVLTEVMPACFNVYQLESYSQSGELQQVLPLPGKRNEGYNIISHPSGPVVLVHKTGAIFI